MWDNKELGFPDTYKKNLIINLEDIDSEIIRDMNYFVLEIVLKTK